MNTVESSISSADWKSFEGELLLAFPALTGDTERTGFLRGKLDSFAIADVRQGFDEYLRLPSKDGFFEANRFIAIATRIHRQRLETESVAGRERAKAEARKADERINTRWDKIDERLKDFTDEQLEEIKQEVIADMKTKGNDFMAEKIADSNPRTGFMTKSLIVEHLSARAKGRTILTIPA